MNSSPGYWGVETQVMRTTYNNGNTKGVILGTWTIWTFSIAAYQQPKVPNAATTKATIAIIRAVWSVVGCITVSCALTLIRSSACLIPNWQASAGVCVQRCEAVLWCEVVQNRTIIRGANDYAKIRAPYTGNKI